MNEKEPIISEIIEYKNIAGITGFDCKVLGETNDLYYKKEFQYSTDKILWSDYKTLSKENLMKVKTYGSDILYIRFKFTQVGDGELYVDYVYLKVNYTEDAKDKVIPDCYWTNLANNSGSACCVQPQIVYECAQCGSGGNLFNPYALGRSIEIYKQLSTLVSNMFGFCVLYFKTEANSRSRDVVLKEYSIEKVIDKQNVKILIPDNALPTRELQFNTMMIDYPVQFEVHIVKSEFKKVFGEKSRPEPHDYLYLQTYMNKMYMVDAVAEPDDFGYTGSYWRVSLVPYQEMSSVKFADEDLQEDTETLIFSAEGKFADEIADEFADNRKDNQLNDMKDYAEGQDFLRKTLESNVRIVEENIYNDWTVISKEHYNMSTADKNELVVEYKYDKGFTSGDERMLSFFFKPIGAENSECIPDGVNRKYIQPLSIGPGENGGIKMRVNYWNNMLVPGNYISSKRIKGVSGFRKILSATKSGQYVEVEGEYTNECKILSNALISGIYETYEIFRIKNEQQNMMSLYKSSSKFILDILGNKIEYDFGTKFENKWYCIVLGLNRENSTAWLYELTGSEQKENSRAVLNLIGTCSHEVGEFNFGDTCDYGLVSGNYNITNIRLWSKLCEQELHNVILSQMIVDDTHNTLIVDNAHAELLLNYKWS